MWWKLARPQVLCRWYQCIERPAEPTPSSNANEIALALHYDFIAPGLHYCSTKPTNTFHTDISSRMMVWQSLQKQAIVTHLLSLLTPFPLKISTLLVVEIVFTVLNKSFCKFQLTPLILPSELRREKEASIKFQQSHKSAMVAFYLNLR